MNKTMIRKPLALLLSIVMLFSSAVVNIPAFASGPATEIVEGDDIIGDYLALPSVTEVYLEGLVYDEYSGRGWVKKPGWNHAHYMHFEYFDDATQVIEINSTAYLPPGTYTILLVNSESTVSRFGYTTSFTEKIGERSLTVTENQAPVPVSGEDLEFEYEIDEDGTFSMNLIQFFEDPDGHSIKITGTDGDAGLSHDDSLITFTPADDWNGQVTGTFTVSDERAFNEQEETAEITITVKPVNDPPVIVAESYSTPVNTDLTILDPALNDTDPEATTVSLVGSVTVPADQGTMAGLVFTPFNGFVGNATLTYVVTDTPADGTTPEQVTGSITVNVFEPGSENFSPEAKDDTVTTTVGTPVTVHPLENDTDAEDDVTPVALQLTTVTILTDVDNDSISFTPGDSFFIYTPNDEFVNTVLVEYTVTDSGGLTDTGQVSIHINVTDVNHEVTALADALSVTEGGTNSVNVVLNDVIPDGFDKIELGVFDANLNATIVNSKWIQVAPESNITGGPFTVYYTVFDTDGSSAEGEVVVTIVEDGADLDLDNHNIIVQEDETYDFNIFTDETLPDNDPVASVVIASQANQGTATVALNGDVTYMADETYDGNDNENRPEDEFTIRVTLTSGEFADVIVYVNITELKNMRLQDDHMRIDENSGWTIVRVLDNDFIPEEINKLVSDNNLAPQHGSISVVTRWSGGKIVRETSYIEYKPFDGYHGDDSFGYKVKDADGEWDEAVVHVDVEKIERQDHMFEYNLHMYPKVNEEGSVDVSTLVYPTYFDLETLEVSSVTFEVPEESSNGSTSKDGTFAKYTPNSMTSVVLLFTVEDAFGHIAKGKITVIVASDATTDYVLVYNLNPLRVNQYSDPEAIRLETDVDYHTGDGSAIEHKFELPEFAPDEFAQGFYEFNKRASNGKYISVTKYFGEFLLQYGMENGGRDIYAALPPTSELRPVSVNGQPLINFENEVDPKDINYGDTVFTPAALVVDDVLSKEWVYNSEDIFDYLYGYDFEDYYHGGLEPTDTMTQNMPMLFDDVTPAERGKVRVQFRLNGTDDTTIHDISDFWTYVVVGNIDEEDGYKENPMGSLMSGVDGEIDYTIYNIDFMMTDSEDFSSEWSDVVTIKVLNEAPRVLSTENEPFDEFKVIQAGDSIEFGSMIDIEDDEDSGFAVDPYNYLALPLVGTQDDLMVKVYDINVYPNLMVWSRDGNDIQDPDLAFDTETPGRYRVEFIYTDIHGLTVEKDLELWIVPESEVYVDLNVLELELNGYFPTFMGVTADFWEPTDSESIMTLDVEEEPMFRNGDIVSYVSAMMGDTEIGRMYVPSDEAKDFGDVYRFTTEEVVDITYHAVQKVYDDGVWFEVVSNLLPVGDMVPMAVDNNKRVITVTDDDFGQYFITSDIGDMSYMEDYFDYDDNYFEGRKFPVVSKYKFVEGDDGEELVGRIVTTIHEEFIPQSESESQLTRRYFTFLDVAETFDGQIYGLGMDQKIWVYNPSTGAFRELADLQQMMNDPDTIEEIRSLFSTEYRSDIQVNYNPVLSLAGDKDGNLVMMLSVNVSLRVESNDNFNDVYNVVGVLSPEGEIVSLDVTDTSDGYVLINDIAYDEELEVLYGIGTNVYNGQDPSSMSASNISDYLNQELFKLEMVEAEDEEEELMELTDLGLMINQGRYVSTVIEPLENSHYSGIAVVDEEIILTKFNTYMYPVDVESAMMPMNEFVTYIDVLDFNGNDIQSDKMLPDLFSWAFGAAATFNKEMTSSISLSSITSGGTTTVVAHVSPVNAFSGTPVWTENGAGSLVEPSPGTSTTIDENGNLTITYQSVAGTAETVSINVTFDGFTEVQTVSVSNPVVVTPTPTTPTRTTTPTPAASPTIAVSLDIDAITLDYGETADPDFTSYDFTETVTGTTNTNVTWLLSDDTFVSVDADGVVTTNDNIPVDTGDITVTLTVTTVDGGETATATIIFEEQTPLGAIEFFEPYISGYSDGTFRENAPVTRAEIASMFARILKLNRTTFGTQKFTDVSKEHWAYGSIQAMYTTGLFSGYLAEDGTRFFDPNKPIGRGEIAQVITNYWNFLDISVTSENNTMIPDVAPNYWAASAINRIFNTGIFNGFDDGTFRPEDPTLRGQVVSMINRLIARPANEVSTGTFTDILSSSEYYGDVEAASQTFLKPQGE